MGKQCSSNNSNNNNNDKDNNSYTDSDKLIYNNER